MNLTLVSYAISRNEIASIHATGCGDIQRDVRRHDGHAIPGYSSIEEAVLDMNADFVAEGNEGYGLDSFKILPCAKAAR